MPSTNLHHGLQMQTRCLTDGPSIYNEASPLFRSALVGRPHNWNSRLYEWPSLFSCAACSFPSSRLPSISQAEGGRDGNRKHHAKIDKRKVSEMRGERERERERQSICLLCHVRDRLCQSGHHDEGGPQGSAEVRQKFR